MTDYAVQTTQLSREFKTVRAVDSLDLEIPRGIVFGFLGPNGAGKTTTIRLLLGLLQPSGGKAETLGCDTVDQAGRIREQTGALLEHTGLYERLNAENNLDYYARIYRMPYGQRKDRIREILNHFGLWDRRKERVGNWSRGMKQKLAVARAILHRPPLLFLDEPTAGLDPIAAASLRDDLAHFVKSEGMTVFLTTHNLVEAEKLCNSVGVINRGRLIAIGHPDDLRNHGGGNRAEIRGNGITDSVVTRLKNRIDVDDAVVTDDLLKIELNDTDTVAPIVSFLVGEGVEIEEVRKGKASLEDAFLAIMEDENVS